MCIVNIKKLPSIILLDASTIIKLSAALNIAFCPKFSIARLVLVLSDAISYFFNDSSYLSASNFSLLKY